MFRRFRMKKLLAIVALLAFACAAPLAMAAEKKAAAPKAPKEVNCCIKGEVKKLTAAECKKEKGKVVKKAEQCKPPKAKKVK